MPMTSPRQSHEPSPSRRWKHGSMRVIGLTGGVAAGKSAVAAILAEHGSVVIDADSVGHEVLEDPAVREQIVSRFGECILAADHGPVGVRAIDRRALGAIVFADPDQRRALESIVHPVMRDRFLASIGREMQPGERRARSIVLDAAILLEAGWDDLCDMVVFVDAPREERMGRAVRQRGWTTETFEARERAQWPCDRKRRRANLVIANSADASSLRGELAGLQAQLAPAELPKAVLDDQRPRSGSVEPAHANAAGVLTLTPRRPDGDLAATS